MPADVQAIKACGVTFPIHLIERVIEKQLPVTPFLPPKCAINFRFAFEDTHPTSVCLFTLKVDVTFCRNLYFK
ncbi:hypothetical protein SAMN04487951_10688 [Vreelandella arcis]|uniref:Uncharacterized protein n=1 Tax=Vreelandella arcis TaxID=416873 RepID=A0A1H0CJZ5_9GAMM|nr:hypothetical protein SAMN04487951_10688 [Halomonas arcis]